MDEDDLQREGGVMLCDGCHQLLDTGGAVLFEWSQMTLLLYPIFEPS